MKRFYRYLIWFNLSIVAFAAQSATDKLVWTPIAKQVCDKLAQASQLYSQGNTLKAKEAAYLEAYFKLYDPVLEVGTRFATSQQHVVAIENQFRALKTAMVPQPKESDKHNVQKISQQLCQAISQDAKALDDQHLPLDVYGTGQ
ncbi:hypothetical protein [uncultured Shewanella sp.]|uniref:hypothetical protein n=1 Tax=uncultured Shewanella sp. TaxID=173975 RepID=UPI0026250999|nr:hypothetical protein [uncultured Shewanella sp.]